MLLSPAEAKAFPALGIRCSSRECPVSLNAFNNEGPLRETISCPGLTTLAVRVDSSILLERLRWTPDT